MRKVCLWFAAAFPLWIVLGCAWAWMDPEAWAWCKQWIKPGLGVIMLGMGLTLRVSDFAAVASHPVSVAMGVGAQFLIMPTAGWTMAKLFGLPPELALGLILVSCCPGGTASNVICYLSKANVALSVLMTMCSTFLAIVLTPLLTDLLAGKQIDVDAWGMFKTMVIIVLIPLVAGIAINTWVGRMKKPEHVRSWVDSVGPLLSVAVIVLIVGNVIATHRDNIAAAGISLFVSVLCFHALGFAIGYLLMKAFKKDQAMRRTVSIEVGMQNSGLGVVLASTHFPKYIMAPVPAAISAVYHCIIGSVLAAWWSRKQTSENK